MEFHEFNDKRHTQTNVCAECVVSCCITVYTMHLKAMWVGGHNINKALQTCGNIKRNLRSTVILLKKSKNSSTLLSLEMSAVILEELTKSNQSLKSTVLEKRNARIKSELLLKVRVLTKKINAIPTESEFQRAYVLSTKSGTIFFSALMRILTFFHMALIISKTSRCQAICKILRHGGGYL